MTTSGAYDSLQRMLSPARGSPPPLAPTRKPLPAFSLEPHLPVRRNKASRRVVSPSLDWWKMQEVLELEYKHGGRAPPLLHGNRTVLQPDLEASSTLSGGVRLGILSDALLVNKEKGEIELFAAEQVSFEDNSFTLRSPPSSSAFSPAEKITLVPSPSLPSLLPLLTRTFLSHPPLPPSSPPPLSPSSAANWTPDSSLLLCECCSTVRFNTLTQRKHHCRGCGRGICGRCSRWKRMEAGDGEGRGEAEKGREVRVCKECFA